MKKVSLIITVLNEEKTVVSLLESIAKQSLLPNEIIIVDGGSSDKTVGLIKNFSSSKLSISFIKKKVIGVSGATMRLRKQKMLGLRLLMQGAC